MTFGAVWCAGRNWYQRWCAQQDSNLQPLAPEANALSN
jgi:hypothetical protein